MNSDVYIELLHLQKCDDKSKNIDGFDNLKMLKNRRLKIFILIILRTINNSLEFLKNHSFRAINILSRQFFKGKISLSGYITFTNSNLSIFERLYITVHTFQNILK